MEQVYVKNDSLVTFNANAGAFLIFVANGYDDRPLMNVYNDTEQFVLLRRNNDL